MQFNDRFCEWASSDRAARFWYALFGVIALIFIGCVWELAWGGGRTFIDQRVVTPVSQSHREVSVQCSACHEAIVSVHSSDTAGNIAATYEQAFAQSGQAFDSSIKVNSAPDSVRAFTLPFLLNFGEGAKLYTACVSENGFAWLVPPSQGCPAVLAFKDEIPSDDVLLSDYSDLRYNGTWEGEPLWGDLWGSALTAAGRADLKPPYSLGKSAAAVAFVWYSLAYVDGPGTVTTEVLLVDRGQGDFDLQFNSTDATTRGPHGFTLGRNQHVVRHATGQTPTTFCFRSGRASQC